MHFLPDNGSFHLLFNENLLRLDPDRVGDLSAGIVE